MIKKLLILPIFFFGCLAAEIRTIDRIEDILTEVDEDTLVAFDIDDTLCHTKEMLFHKEGYEVMVSILRQAANSGASREQVLKWCGIIMANLHERPLDEGLLPTLSEIKSRQADFMGLTARSSQELDPVGNTGDHTLKQLENLGIRFSMADKIPNMEFWGRINPKSVRPPFVYKGGCLFTASTPKGGALMFFLKRNELTPKKVVIVDDKMKYLSEVSKTLDAAGINNVCFLYRAVDHIKEPPVDVEIVKTQIKHLIETDTWMSEEEAANTMSGINH